MISQRSEVLQGTTSDPEPISEIVLKAAPALSKRDGAEENQDGLCADKGWDLTYVFNLTESSTRAKSQPECEEHHLMCWGPGLKRKWQHSFPSASFLSCDPLPNHHASPAMMDWNCEPNQNKTTYFFSLVIFLSSILSQQPKVTNPQDHW